MLLAIGGGTTLDLAKVLRCRHAWPAMQLTDLWLVPAAWLPGCRA